MWSWTDPVRDVLQAFLNRICAPYVENLDSDRLNYGLTSGKLFGFWPNNWLTFVGQLALTSLKLKRSALDKFRLPVDVLEGHLGRLTLSIPWTSLSSRPVEICIEDFDPEDDERRTQAIKAEKLKSSEVFQMRGQSDELDTQPQGFVPSLVAKIINNLQITVKNIHVRYEDNMSVHGSQHPFAAGVTLAGFTAVSVDELWLPTFIQSTASSIHKLARLESLAVYFDTDCPSMAGLPVEEALKEFTSMIARSDHTPDHQFVLKPVTGEGKITLNKRMDTTTAKTNVDLAFEEIAFTLDGHQYRDIISLIDMYHFYLRRHQYRRYAPDETELGENKSRVLIKFATTSVLREIQERNRKRTFAYIKEVADNRRVYMFLFRRKLLNQLSPDDTIALERIEYKLSYEDIQLYRYLTRRQLRKDIREGKLQEQKPYQEQKKQTGGWGLGWLLGYGSNTAPEEQTVQTGNIWNMTDEQQKELYAALDYDQGADANVPGEIPPDFLKMRVSAQLEHGSLTLKSTPKAHNIISVISDRFKVGFVERPNNFETTIALGGFEVFDGTISNTAYPQIVRLKEKESALLSPISAHEEDPFLYLKFESRPLDERADSALTLRLRYMEIIYHKGYVEAIYNFFRPPESQLESVDALLGAASQTLEGLRQETRAGLEYALNSHKTIDVKMDMQAPIIIIPEDITSETSSHLVLDAGHIAIESELAAKDARREVHEKLDKTHNLEDSKALEKHMYDRFSITFEAAQFLLGPDLKSCLQALESPSDKGSFHIVERINLQLLLQNSILPSRVRLPATISIPRIKVSGRLPALQINVSDRKYKTLMRFIDTAIPTLGQTEPSHLQNVQLDNHTTPNILKPSGFFLSDQVIDYPLEDGNEEASPEDNDVFMDAEDDSSQRGIKPQNFVLNFEVDRLEALVSKTDGNGVETELGDLRLENFRLGCEAEDFKVNVDIALRSISMTLSQAGQKTVPLLASREDISVPEGDLLTISYIRIQDRHPDFTSKHDGFDQDIKILISTIIFYACPEPVIALYDFIMTTFVPERSLSPPQSQTISSPNDITGNYASPRPLPRPSKIRVDVNLASVQVLLLNNNVQLATLALSTASASVKILGNTLKMNGVLGSLSLFDDSDLETHSDSFKQILTIEGDNLANFGYQTFDPEDKATFKGVNSFIMLKSGALRLTFLEGPYHDIYQFLIKFAKLKGLYDAAAAAAAQRAAEIQRLQFDVFIQSPILVFPRDPKNSEDTLVMKLGEISARNSYQGTVVKTEATLQGIQLTSEMFYQDKLSQMNIIDEVQIGTTLIQNSDIDRTQNFEYPDNQMSITVSDVKLHLTQYQYYFLTHLIRSIPKIIQEEELGKVETSLSPPSTISQSQSISASSSSDERTISVVNLQPELETVSVDGIRPWTSLDLELNIGSVKLHLYDETAKMSSDLKTSGIARFALNDTRLRYKSLTDGAAEAELILRSFTMTNTRSGSSRFREIIPAAKHSRNQFMVLYTTSGGIEPSSVVIVTVDSPRVIFSVDPVFALLSFFSDDNENLDLPEKTDGSAIEHQNQERQSSGLDFRIDLHDVIISVLETDTAPDTQAIQLSIKQILLSQQTIMALTVNRLGMSLLRMDKPLEAVRFLDDLDLTFSMDNRQITDQRMSNLEVSLQTIIFRVSYRDIILISSIINKAVELSTQHSKSDNASFYPSEQGGTSSKLLSNHSTSVGTQGRRGIISRAVTSKENFKGVFDGFRLVLIGDIYELPVLHLSTRAFEIKVQDWSADLHANTSIDTSITYWNLGNSHWEPLIDPWSFSISVGRQGASGGFSAKVASQSCLDVNVSMTLIELGLSMFDAWQKEGDRVLRKARGGFAPYRIRNHTGGSIHVWSDIDGSSHKHSPAVKIANGETIDWRFDDWKTMREHVAVTGHNSLGIQFISKPWEQLHNIAVDSEGECVYTLRPKTQKVSPRLLCEVSLKGHVKLVTLRSTFRVQNNTLYPLELMLLDCNGQPASAVEKIAPGDDYPLPIDGVTENKITMRPDQGFGYKWSNPLQWEDLLTKPSRLLVCRHTQSTEPAWRLQAWAEYDSNDPLIKRYPKMTLHLRAPIEVENLLPYNVQYRIFDKELDQNWSSYLRQGGLMPVHCVELDHLVLLNVTVQDTCFKPSDWAIINPGTSGDFETEKQLIIKDPGDRKLDLRLNYIKHENSGGAFKVQIYSPFIVINKTGLPFQFLALRSTRAGVPQEIAGERKLTELAKPTPFLLSHFHSRGHEFVLKVGNSSWSQVIDIAPQYQIFEVTIFKQTLSFEAPSAEMALSLPTLKDTESNIGVSWTRGQGKYELSKVITLAPRFLIKNKLDYAIQFREKGMLPNEESLLQPGTRASLRSTRRSSDKLLTIAYSGLNAKWSTPINIQDIGVVHFRLYPPGEENTEPRLVRADVAIEGPTIHVSLGEEMGSWPFIIENASDYDVQFCQVDEFHAEVNRGDSPSSYIMHRVKRHSTLNYAWDLPATRNKELTLLINGKARRVDIMEIGNLPPFKFPSEHGTRAVSLDIRADGLSQRLNISDYRESTSLYKPKRRSSTSSRQDTLGSIQDSFEVVAQEEAPTLTINLNLAGLGVSLMNRNMVEVVYMSLRQFDVEYNRTATAQSITMSCANVQIDNQLHDAIFPVALQPTPLPKQEGMTTPPPAIQMSIVYLNDQAHGVLFVKYASVLLQSLTIRLDEDFLLTLYDMTKMPSVSWGERQSDVLIPYPTEIPEPSNNAEGQSAYFEVLELQPIKLIISFMTTQRMEAQEKFNTSNPFAFIIRGLLNFLGNVNDAPFRLNALVLNDLRQTVPDLQRRIIYHYRQEILRQAIRLMGFADFVGNPVGLFENISSGMVDAFYEPWTGVIVHGLNKDFGIGVVKGVSSLIKKSVFGVSDSFSKVTSSLGKGLATATFDVEWDNRRRLAQRRNKPRHILDGVATGAEAFAASVGSGVEGLVMKPIEGAQASGAGGFFKGIGKGVVGLVAKPAVGFMDLASNLGAEMSSHHRPQPRHIPADGVLKAYSAREALGQSWMKDLEQGSYRNEQYVAHYDLPGGDNTLMLTMSKVLSLRSNKLRLDWELPFSQIQGINIEDSGILFQSKSGRDRDRFVCIADSSAKVWFFTQIEQVVKTYNARRSLQRRK
ncbi:hypothetical protein Clacol_003911 [Clathrus columnatus]|uniref:Vacuolar protein sorting-associated protein n=1 Tax=Clathrus columnatus TaxID=1419009 RepID=A0AAV5A850_9AGAM|nr:hypothetical protein Clacol_003911 [Clathrus columnatus]